MNTIIIFVLLAITIISCVAIFIFFNTRINTIQKSFDDRNKRTKREFKTISERFEDIYENLESNTKSLVELENVIFPPDTPRVGNGKRKDSQ